MKEKNLNFGPVEDHNQDSFSAGKAKKEEDAASGQETNDQSQDNYADEYDSYSPWG
jgi:hypothetical protein